MTFFINLLGDAPAQDPPLFATFDDELRLQLSRTPFVLFSEREPLVPGVYNATNSRVVACKEWHLPAALKLWRYFDGQTWNAAVDAFPHNGMRLLRMMTREKALNGPNPIWWRGPPVDVGA